MTFQVLDFCKMEKFWQTDIFDVLQEEQFGRDIFGTLPSWRLFSYTSIPLHRHHQFKIFNFAQISLKTTEYKTILKISRFTDYEQSQYVVKFQEDAELITTDPECEMPLNSGTLGVVWSVKSMLHALMPQDPLRFLTTVENLALQCCHCTVDSVECPEHVMNYDHYVYNTN